MHYQHQALRERPMSLHIHTAGFYCYDPQLLSEFFTVDHLQITEFLASFSIRCRHYLIFIAFNNSYSQDITDKTTHHVYIFYNTMPH